VKSSYIVQVTGGKGVGKYEVQLNNPGKGWESIRFNCIIQDRGVKYEVKLHNPGKGCKV
jgi:hypothetical protein